MDNVDSTPPVEISRVAVRLPPFWAEWPAVWFAQDESQFSLAGISSETIKCFHIISQLDHQYAAEVEDIIISPPERDPYTTLRAELVRRLTPSRGQRIRQLLTIEEMGDSKPSQFLRHLRSLAPDVSEDFLSTIWSSWLPPNIQAHLACQPECSLDAAARCADRISEVAPQLAVASDSPPRVLHSNRRLRTTPGRRRHSAPRGTASVPALRTLPSATETPTPVPEIPAPAPEIPTRTADPHTETTQHPPSAGTTADSAPEHKSVHHPAPTISGETKAADITGGTCLLHNEGPPLRY
jgi:hypothetical protein